MERSLLRVLYRNIASFFHLSSCDNINSELVQKYYQKAEEILKLLKPKLDAIGNSEIKCDEILNKTFEELALSVDELRELFNNWQPLSSKIYFVLQVELVISKIRSSVSQVFLLLKSSHQHLINELSSAPLEQCIQKIKHMGYEQSSSVVNQAMKDQVEGVSPSSEIMVKIAESLSLRSSQEVLIEAVALEKLKENAEQTEKTGEAHYIEQMIALVAHMHDRLVRIKQSQNSSPVPTPIDFCCPLSLELMMDPVILSSGQTYERNFIQIWIDLGLAICPKTRQTLTRTNLTPNYTVKALIASWCESNNVKLVDPIKSMNSKQSSLLVQPECGAPSDSQIPPQSSDNQSISPERTRSISSPTRLSPCEIQREGTSPLHPCSTSDSSFSGISGNGQGSDIRKISSIMGYEDRSANAEEQHVDSIGQPFTSPSRKEIFNSTGADEESSWSHYRTPSASSTLSNTTLPQGTPGDTNEDEVHQVTYSSDASGEVKSETLVLAALRSLKKEPEFPHRLERRSQSQTIQHQSPEKFIPRIVSSPALEKSADLSGIETQVWNLVEDLKSTSVEVLREATAKLRLLAKYTTENRIVIANCGAISLLVSLLRSTDTKIQENAVTTLLNLSINNNNKTAIASAEAINPLIHVLETGSPEAKENSAATLFSLSVIEANKARIGRSGAIKPLIDLLGNGTPRGKKDAATALYNLSMFHENKARIVQDGAVKYLVELMDPGAGMVEKAVAVLANLTTIPEGRAAIGQEGGIPFLVEVVELGSARGKENAAASLLQLCTDSGRFCNMVLQEGAVPPLVQLAQSGTPRAKEKAQLLLSYFRNQRHSNGRRS